MMEQSEFVTLRNFFQRVECESLLPELDVQAVSAWAEKERLEALYRVKDSRQRIHYRDAFYEAWGAALAIDSRIASIKRHLELLDEWEADNADEA